MIKHSSWPPKVAAPIRKPILVCICGRKYLKTRDAQITCVWCIERPVPTTND